MALEFEPYVRTPDDKGNELLDDHKIKMANVIGSWSVLETNCEKLLCALAQTPLTLGQTLTEDLGPDHRLKALRRLCRNWEIVLPRNHELQPRLKELRSLATWVAQNKDARNRLVHWHWRSRGTDALVCFKYSFKPPTEDKVESPFLTTSVKSLTGFFIEIAGKNRELKALLESLETLPPWQEILPSHDSRSPRPKSQSGR